MAKEFLKIWFSDIELAHDFFDGNDKHLGEFLVNVYRSYAELPTSFRCKQVEKYFKTYSKQIEFIKKAKADGLKAHLQDIESQEDKGQTLEGGVQGGAQPPLLPTPPPKGESINSKEEKEKYKEYINTCIETLYSIYPTRCTLRNTATGKGKKNKIQIEKLLAKNTFEELQEIFNLYLDDCKQGKKYLKDFTTFLNNLPDVDSLKKPIVNEQASASNQNMPMSHEAKHIHKKLPDPMMLTEATYYSECIERFIEPLDYYTLKPLDLSLDVITIPVDYSKTILKK